jgi:putative membrane protein
MTSKGGDGYIAAPRRAMWVRPLSWRRTGYLIVDGVILIRHGVLRRRLVVVPLARLQSLEVQQGPLGRMLRLASARFHTVEGPVRPRLPIVDRDQAVLLFDEVSREAVASAGRDTSHRWNEVRAQVRPVETPRQEGAQA